MFFHLFIANGGQKSVGKKYPGKPLEELSEDNPNTRAGNRRISTTVATTEQRPGPQAAVPGRPAVVGGKFALAPNEARPTNGGKQTPAGSQCSGTGPTAHRGAGFGRFVSAFLPL